VQNVEATILGEHGDAQVPIFSKVRIDGRDPDFSANEREEILEDLQESAMNVIERKGAPPSGARRPASPTWSRPSSATRARCSPALSSSTASTVTTAPPSASPSSSDRTASREVVDWDLDDYEQGTMAEAADKLAEQYEKIS